MAARKSPSRAKKKPARKTTKKVGASKTKRKVKTKAKGKVKTTGKTKTKAKTKAKPKPKTGSKRRKSTPKRKTARKYGPGSQTEVKREMHRFKRGKAHSGPKLKPVKSREQAIAIGLSKARKKGIRVPKKPK